MESDERLERVKPKPSKAHRPCARRAVYFVGLAVLAIVVGFAGFDRWFYETVALRLNTPSPVDADFYHATHPIWDLVRLFPHVLGGSIAYVCVLTLRRHGWRRANLALLGVAVAAIVANVAQDGIGRLRPNQAESALAFTPLFAGFQQQTPVGFPSGEVATAVALAAALRREFRSAGSLFLAMAGLVIVARVLFGMHYFSDVVAGAVLGWWVEGFARRVLLSVWRRKGFIKRRASRRGTAAAQRDV